MRPNHEESIQSAQLQRLARIFKFACSKLSTFIPRSEYKSTSHTAMDAKAHNKTSSARDEAHIDYT